MRAFFVALCFLGIAAIYDDVADDFDHNAELLRGLSYRRVPMGSSPNSMKPLDGLDKKVNEPESSQPIRDKYSTTPLKIPYELIQLIRTGKEQDITNWLIELRKDGGPANMRLGYNLLVCAYSHEKKPYLAEDCLMRMLEMNFSPALQAFQAVVQGFEEIGETERALKWTSRVVGKEGLGMHLFTDSFERMLNNSMQDASDWADGGINQKAWVDEREREMKREEFIASVKANLFSLGASCMIYGLLKLVTRFLSGNRGKSGNESLGRKIGFSGEVGKFSSNTRDTSSAAAAPVVSSTYTMEPEHDDLAQELGIQNASDNQTLTHVDSEEFWGR